MKYYSTEYCQYFLLYTNDIMAIMQTSDDFIRNELGKRFVVNPNSIGPPTQYLENKGSYVNLQNGRSAWSISQSQYFQDAMKNVIDVLVQEGKTLPKRGKYLWTSNYRPDTDTSTEIPPPRAS